MPERVAPDISGEPVVVSSTRFFVVEKPGLHVATIAGYEEADEGE